MENKVLLKKTKVFGKQESKEAYIIRDFLKRSVVTFDWIPVENIAEFRAGQDPQAGENARLPVVQLPCGEYLYNPSVEQIACKLGWVTKPKLNEYDISIFGAGPAGLSAAVYAASEGLKTVLVEREAIGGQAGTSSRIENYLGFPNGITGAELAERARQQAVKFGVDILLIRRGNKAEFVNRKLHVELIDGNHIVSKSNICATGVEYSRLDVKGEDKFLNMGVYYGAGASEAFLCANKHIFIVGGGNSAGQAALNFCKHAKKVTMIIRGNDLAASLSYYLLNRITAKKNIEVMYNSKVTALYGDCNLNAIEITDQLHHTSQCFETKFIFVCIGGKPNTEWAKDTAIIRDDAGYLVTGSDLYKPPFIGKWNMEHGPEFLETSVPGCFAAGDVRHNSIKRVASAVGEGAMAITFAHRFLHENY